MESEKTVTWSFVEMLDASRREESERNQKNHAQIVKVLWRVIVGLLILLVLSIGVIGYGIWWINQYDTVSYDQDGNGNNIIGDFNRGYYNEPEIEDTTEEESE